METTRQKKGTIFLILQREVTLHKHPRDFQEITKTNFCRIKYVVRKYFEGSLRSCVTSGYFKEVPLKVLNLTVPQVALSLAPDP